MFRIALANLRFPDSPDEAIALAVQATADAAAAGAGIVCFPEAYVPGYRALGRPIAPPTEEYLERAWTAVADAARAHRITVVLGTERIEHDAFLLTALVINSDGTRAGFQDKVQLDPSVEDAMYTPGHGRHVFQAGALTFGVVICHEGWRYPETVRDVVRQGAQVVFHPHFGEAEPGSFRPTTYADPANTFHEAAVLCRAAENGCYFATVNCASEGSPTASAIANPDGTLLAYQPYGVHGLLIADLDLTLATRLLALRCRS
jgi:predicted amidohydrolase